MNTVFVVSVWAWVALVATVLLLALYRLVVTRGLWTVLHVRQSELSLVPQQILQDHRIERIDLWGQALTAAAVILGLLLAATYLYVVIGPLPPAPFPVC
jgi:hypothetical protein